jgi:hypothetical protein
VEVDEDSNHVVGEMMSGALGIKMIPIDLCDVKRDGRQLKVRSDQAST